MGSKLPLVVFVAFMAALSALMIVARLHDEKRRLEIGAIERGYALHCPKDGRFAWKDECND